MELLVCQHLLATSHKYVATWTIYNWQKKNQLVPIL